MRGLLRSLSIICLFILLTTTVHAYYKVGDTYQAEADYHYPIIFIPGVMGSILAEDAAGVADESWPGMPHEDRTELALKDNGKTPVVRGTEIYPYATVRKVWYWEPVYDGFFNYMDERTYYKYRGEVDGVGYLDRAYFDHPYDFRLATEEHLKNGKYSLTKKVKEVLKHTKSDKVILVAHSMGGLMARMYAKENPSKIAGIVFLSNPHNGAPRGFESVTQGYNFGAGALVTEEAVWRMGHNWPGIYHLMPNKEFVSKDGKELTLEETYKGDYISYQQSLNIKHSDMQKIYEKGISNPDEVTKELIKMGYGSLSNEIVDKTFSFRKKFDLITLPSSIPFILLNGNNQKTTYAFNVTEDTVTRNYLVGIGEYDGSGREPTYAYMSFNIWNFHQENNFDGDETVDAHGLEWNKATQIKKFDASHMKVPSNVDVLNDAMEFIEEINHDERDRHRMFRIRGEIAAKMLDLVGKTQEELALDAEGLANRSRMSKDGERKTRIIGDIKARGTTSFFLSLIEDQQYNVQITVPGAGDYQKEEDFQAWIAFDGFRMVDSGIGTVRPVSYKVTMTESDFEAVIAGDLSLEQAWEQDKIDMGLRIWFVEWIAGWVARFTS